MYPEYTDAPASEMLEVWQLVVHQNSANANPSLYAQLHTKTITVSKIHECLSSSIGVALPRMFSLYIHYKEK